MRKFKSEEKFELSYNALFRLLFELQKIGTYKYTIPDFGKDFLSSMDNPTQQATRYLNFWNSKKLLNSWGTKYSSDVYREEILDWYDNCACVSNCKDAVEEIKLIFEKCHIDIREIISQHNKDIVQIISRQNDNPSIIDKIERKKFDNFVRLLVQKTEQVVAKWDPSTCTPPPNDDAAKRGTASFQTAHRHLSNTLAPIRTSFWINEYKQEIFIGREAFLESFGQWKEHRGHSGSYKSLLLKGDLGTGKTALMVYLEQSKHLDAVFYCRRNSSVTADSKTLVCFIADYLLQTIPEYATYWEETPFPKDPRNLPVDQLITALISIPLSGITPNQDMIFGIDALDEVAANTDNQIKTALLQLFELTPPWVRFVITGRDTADLHALVRQHQIWDLQQDAERDNDMHAYLEHRLAPLSPRPEEIAVLVAKADGSFLYAKTICVELLNTTRSLDDVSTFPRGMSGIYAECFDRLVQKGINYAGALRPALEILAASYDAVSTALLNEMEIACFDAVCAAVELFPQRNGVILPVHSSVFEWLSSPDAGKYQVQVINGHKKLVQYFIENEILSRYALKYLTAHALEAKEFVRAEELLKNVEFQNERFQKYGAEAVGMYFQELKQLSGQKSSSAYEVMTSICFRDLILGKYRKTCYDYGYFFLLSEARFDEVLMKKTESWGYPAEAGVAYYKYGTKTFHDAMSILEQLFSSGYTRLMDIDEKAELRNMYALCLLKNSDYEIAKDNYKSVLATTPSLIHQAEAHMNLGKLACYQLVPNWRSLARQSFDDAISCLKEELRSNYSQSLSLRMADYCRISALYAGIWAGQLGHAEEALEEAQAIYDVTPVRARYHARYVYTKATLKIWQRDLDEAIKNLIELQNSENEIIKDYETTQIAFFTGVIYILKNDTENACLHLKKVLNTAGPINSWIEYEEARTLLTEITGKWFGKEDTSKLPGIDYINDWCQHVSNMIKELKSTYDIK